MEVIYNQDYKKTLIYNIDHAGHAWKLYRVLFAPTNKTYYMINDGADYLFMECFPTLEKAVHALKSYLINTTEEITMENGLGDVVIIKATAAGAVVTEEDGEIIKTYRTIERAYNACYNAGYRD